MYHTGTKEISNFLADRLKFHLDGARLYEPVRNQLQWLSFHLELTMRPTRSVQFKSFSDVQRFTNTRFFAAGAGTWASGEIAALAVEKTVGGSDDVGYLIAPATVIIRHSGGTQTFAVITKVTNQQSIDLHVVGTATNIADGDDMMIVGAAFGESSQAGPALSTILTSQQFYTQDKEHSWEMTDVSAVEDNYVTGEFDRLGAKTLIEHKTDIDRSSLFSLGGETTMTLDDVSAGTETVRTMYGLGPWMTANSASLAGGTGSISNTYSGYTIDSFVGDSENIFMNDPGGKVFISGAGPLGHIQKFGSNMMMSGAHVNVEQGLEMFDLNVTRIRNVFGTAVWVWDKNMAGSGLYRNRTLVADLDYSAYRVLDGFGTHLMTNVQNDREFRIKKFLYRTVAGMEYGNPENFAEMIFT